MGHARRQDEPWKSYVARRKSTRRYLDSRIKTGILIYDGSHGPYINPQRQILKAARGTMSARQWRKYKHN